VALVRVLTGFMFVRVVTESENYRIYEAVLQTIKAATRNLSGALNFIALVTGHVRQAPTKF
jgi:hypothetical protein